MNNLLLNPDKIQFKSTDCKFFGHRLTPEGLKPDPEKIKAILAMQPPQSIQQLQSFNGMVNYLKRFSPVLSELAEPLRKLQKSDTVWAWESEQQTAFEKTKTALTTLPVLAYFDKNKEHIIQTDASKTGLGAVLLQEGQPVVYAARTLTDTERRYSNIERATRCSLWTGETAPLYFWEANHSGNRSPTINQHLEEDYSDIQPKTAKTTSETGPV